MPRLWSLDVGAPAHFTTAEPWSSGIYKSPVVGRIPLSFVNLAGAARPIYLFMAGRTRRCACIPMDHYPFVAPQSWRSTESGPGMVRRKLLESKDRPKRRWRSATRLKSAQRWCRSRSRARRAGSSAAGGIVSICRSSSCTAASTGWYLRVIETGHVESGDVLTVVERPYPHLTVDAVNATAYSRGGATNMDAARELANCPALAEAWRGEFRNLVE